MVFEPRCCAMPEPVIAAAPNLNGGYQVASGADDPERE